MDWLVCKDCNVKGLIIMEQDTKIAVLTSQLEAKEKEGERIRAIAIDKQGLTRDAWLSVTEMTVAFSIKNLMNEVASHSKQIEVMRRALEKISRVHLKGSHWVSSEESANEAINIAKETLATLSTITQGSKLE